MDTQKPKKALRNLFSRTEESDTLKENSTALRIGAEAAPQSEASKIESKHEVSREEPSILATPLQTQSKLTSMENSIAVTSEPLPSHQDSSNSSSSLKAVDSATPYSFTKIQYNLNLFKAERTNWNENDYISFINKIDQSQTDAFFLKGRLISEIKERFYFENKKGWSLFCDETLNMNYTTANQYIRVSQEFDVTSHQRKDFGFEHFKALLPLTEKDRNELITQTPKNLSVKNLRELVSKKIVPASKKPLQEKQSLLPKEIISTLQKLKTQLTQLKKLSLNQEEKWQLYGAFKHLSEEMSSLSHSFEDESQSSLSNEATEASLTLS